MPSRPIKRVEVTYEDGSVAAFDFDEETSAGYIREEYTWEAKEGGEGLAKWGGRLKTYQIFWTERMPK